MTKGQLVREMICAIAGTANRDDQYVGKRVYGRRGTEFETAAGVVTNTSICQLNGCGGTRLHVRWPDGHRTYPCAKGCETRDDGDLEIG